jgi:hypothetical protein
MKALLSGIAALGLIAAAAPAWSQAMSAGTTAKQNAPGSGGISGTGIQGMPGIKSGLAVKPSAPAGADESGVPGLPGNKSGPAVRAPGQMASNEGRPVNLGTVPKGPSTIAGQRVGGGL